MPLGREIAMNNVHSRRSRRARDRGAPLSRFPAASAPSPGARQQEVVAAARRHEPGRPLRKIGGESLDHHPAPAPTPGGARRQRIAIIAEPEHVAIPEPLLLDELELALERAW